MSSSSENFWAHTHSTLTLINPRTPADTSDNADPKDREPPEQARADNTVRGSTRRPDT